MSGTADASSPFPWPVTLLLALVCLAGLATFVSPQGLLPGFPFWLRALVALLLIAAGLALGMAAQSRFQAAGTTAMPTRASTALVESGIYRHSRNPMYLGMGVSLAGLALALDSLWILATVPVFLVGVHLLAVRREERYLEQRFGDAYRNYCRRVPRWVGPI